MTTTRTMALVIGAILSCVSVASSQTSSTRLIADVVPEAAPVFRVQDVIAEEYIQGSDYFIRVDVPVRENRFLFTIQTSYGEFHALGRNLLELRLQEMYSIEQARKLVNDPQMVKGIIETIKQTPQGFKVVLGDPGGAIKRAPKGLKRMASNLFDAQNQRAGGEERRKFAVQIGCDPETSNPVLIALLDNLAVRKSIGKTGSNLGINIALPGLGLLSTSQNFKDELLRRSPAEINSGIEKELLMLGVMEPLARKFCREPSYTTYQRMVFMDHLRVLRRVENIQFLIYRATVADNEADGLAVIKELKLLRQIHESYGINRIDLQGLPVAMLKDNSLVIVNASDYIYDSQELRDAMAAFRRVRPNDAATFVSAGKVSEKARNTFARHSILVSESGKTRLAERSTGQSK